MTTNAVTVDILDRDTHEEWITTQPWVSFLQVPAWSDVKIGWRSESIGWTLNGDLVGAALVLHRSVPGVASRTLSYLPGGPSFKSGLSPSLQVNQWAPPLIRHLRNQGSFQVKIGPPLVMRTWQAETVKRALAEAETGEAALLSHLAADHTSVMGVSTAEELLRAGWTQQGTGGAGFEDVQPRYVYCLDLANSTSQDLLAGFNQLWRRNIRKAERSGVTTRLGERSDIGAFHKIYVETAQRDHFTPRGQVYFERMWDALNSSHGHALTLHLAEVDGHLAAATVMVRVGHRAWYCYGASTTADRAVRPSNALQWHMIEHAVSQGCRVYDLRGISSDLRPDNPLQGLIRFKVGAGGYAQEYIGEWDYVIRPLWAAAFSLYRRLRG